ncbi:MAG: carboxypeptidase-like regulatory domain-containing protein [Thermoplasmata archaeon]|nr:MAG: carboxypeptidase-like regulatory domain-containing protein [Thermoplasmata archaeon]
MAYPRYPPGGAPPPGAPYPYMPYPPPRKKPSNYPTMAGILLILAAVFGLITTAGLLYFSTIDLEEALASDSSEGASGIIDGTVVYAKNDSAVPGVLVELEDEDKNTTTNIDGYFIFEDLSEGEYTLIFSKEGYKTVYYTTYLLASEELTIDIELEEGEGEDEEEDDIIPLSAYSDVCRSCSVLILFFSIFAIIGAYYSFVRKNYWLAKMGAVFGIFAVGFVIGAILALVALILLLMSKDAFS